MNKRSKRYQVSEKAVDRTKKYSLKEAIGVIKNFSPAKFDESVSINFQLGLKADQSDQSIRGTATLPHGSGKKLCVLCFAQGEAQRAAQDAGADFIGAEDMVQKVESGWLDFDAVVATPDMMRTISRLGKVLGPRGLMPTPKTGTVTPDVAKAIKEIKAGRVEFKSDKTGGVHVLLGKRSFPEGALFENAKVVVKSIIDAKPSAVKGDYIKGVSISLSQNPGLRIQSSALSVAEG